MEVVFSHSLLNFALILHFNAKSLASISQAILRFKCPIERHSTVGIPELEKLQYLSLVSKVCQELDNHIGVSDTTLAEFIIDLAKIHEELPAFPAALEENRAKFPAAFAPSLLPLIKTMTPTKRLEPGTSNSGNQLEQPTNARPFPGLALPNDSERKSAG